MKLALFQSFTNPHLRMGRSSDEYVAKKKELETQIAETSRLLLPQVQEDFFQQVIRQALPELPLSRTEEEVKENKLLLKVLYKTLFSLGDSVLLPFRRQFNKPYSLGQPLDSKSSLTKQLHSVEKQLTPPVLLKNINHQIWGSLLNLPKSSLEKKIKTLKQQLEIVYRDISTPYQYDLGYVNVRTEILNIMAKIDELKQGLSFAQIQQNTEIQKLYCELNLLLRLKA